jgi:hypothetical protein
MKKNNIEISKNKFWGKCDIREKTKSHFSIGSLKLWLELYEKELKAAFFHSNSENENNSSSEIPSDIVWNRWSIKTDQPPISLEPQFPDKPIVVKPESSFRLAKGEKARVYVRVPLWLQIIMGTKQPELLMEMPTVVLSKTWFGSFFEGELCNWISSGMKKQIEADSSRPYLAICPIQILNKSDVELLIEKICLRVINLSIFDNGDQLWSDEIKITYRGKNEISQFEVGNSPPIEAPSAKLITKPRTILKKSKIALTFSTLRELPGFGIRIG